jgi:hypothetical protein
MTDYNFESEDSEGNWEHFSNESNWSETQWRSYLRGTDRDSARFLSIYNSLKDKQNHLDEVASLMGWDSDDISLTDEISSETADSNSSDESNNPNDSNDSFSDTPNSPYTLHKHPVYIVTKALYKYLNQSWEHFIEDENNKIPANLCWKYAQSLHKGELNVLLSIQALDLGDYGLAICHLKNSLSELNKSLDVIGQLEHEDSEYLSAFLKELKIRIFDLRELWIRVMGDCRYEYQRRGDKEQD